MSRMVVSLRTSTVYYDWALVAYGHDGVESMVGVIPYWLKDYEGESDLSSLSEYMVGCYGFPVSPMGGLVDTVTQEYVSPYAEDPRMKAMAMTTVRVGSGETMKVYHYEYGIVGLVKGSESIVYRFD